MPSVQVKVCGITNLRDAQLAVELGAAMLGFNFYAKSPRYLSPQRAAEIVAALPRGVEPVGVLVNETAEEIQRVAQMTGIRAAQLHGDESAALCRDIRSATALRVIKALRTAPGFTPATAAGYSADSILMDAHCGDYGGSGQLADWNMARAVAAVVPSVILAGGLNADNIARAICEVRPSAVDVCSGVESVPGKKDEQRLRAFFAAVQKTQEESNVDG